MTSSMSLVLLEVILTNSSFAKNHLYDVATPAVCWISAIMPPNNAHMQMHFYITMSFLYTVSEYGPKSTLDGPKNTPASFYLYNESDLVFSDFFNGY